VLALLLALLLPAGLQAQSIQPPPPGAPTEAGTPPDQPAAPPAEPEPTPSLPDERRFFDTVTVTSTLNPLSVKESPSTVSVIDAETIDRQLIQTTADLVRFEPGIYVESNLTRVGLNGFNIRGIGGNRVMTMVDGVETAEQFDFGPFNVHQFQIDLDALKSVELVRSAGSSMYGSDALGGVVSFFTKDPADYLAGQAFHLGARTVFDSRAREGSGNIVVAGGRPRLQASLFASYVDGGELRTRGTRASEDATRTVANPQDRRSVSALGKLVFTVRPGHVLRISMERADHDIDTTAFSARGVIVQGPFRTTVSDISSTDTLQRTRASIDHRLENRGGLNQVFWSAYVQDSRTDQVVDEVRTTAGIGPVVTALRRGTLDFEQKGYGGSVQGRKLVMPGGQAVLFTFGGSYRHNRFDMIRDRVDVNAATGAVIPVTNVILPTKYFPRSDVDEAGTYLQAEIRVGRLTLVPGVRYDRYSMDADETDQVFLASLSPAPADFRADAVSSRVGAAFALSPAVTVHAQYAGGFRAPPYSAVNSGFTNLAGGYTTLPNSELRAETSDNVEAGVRVSARRTSLGVTVFSNHYDDFIQQVSRGFNPFTRLLEFQNQNVAKVTIRGVELRGDARLARDLRLRAAYTLIRGHDVSGAIDVPLDTLAPDQGVVGLEYAPATGRWGTELIVRAVAGQIPERAGENAFVPDAYTVADAIGWVALGRDVMLRAGVLNLTNVRYFEWANVRGRGAADPAIDRFSSPGISGIASLSFGW
jgi:hemoglobin/transferrin/lactoferrin receptor protein